MTTTAPERRSARPYDFFMLGLCLYALMALGVQAFLEPDEATRQILEWADHGVCLVFFIDFVATLVRTDRRWHYLATWGWIDLVSSIPMIDPLRLGRAARILRIFRVLRGVRATKLLASFILERRAESTALSAALISLLLLIFSSVAIIQFEDVPEANIEGPADALWWAFATMTTVGYGDRFPVTTEGRFVGGMLMTAGVGLFGTLSGFVAAWFLTPDREKQENELEQLRTELRLLREAIAQKG
ncbi:MAG: ion transporter [Candidatus Handelsmanbacteria bacterium]|nr:ion transporter [Candidatus Handelsmanbacteria bacterium]